MYPGRREGRIGRGSFGPLYLWRIFARTHQLCELAAGGSFRINRGSSVFSGHAGPQRRRRKPAESRHTVVANCSFFLPRCAYSLFFLIVESFLLFLFLFFCQTLRQSSPLCDRWNKTEAGVKLPRSRSRLDRKILSGISFYTGAHKAECSKKGNLTKKCFQGPVDLSPLMTPPHRGR